MVKENFCFQTLTKQGTMQVYSTSTNEGIEKESRIQLQPLHTKEPACYVERLHFPSQPMHTKLVELLEEEHSRSQSIRIAEWVGHSKHRFASLVAIVCGENKTLSQRGAWAIAFCAEFHREIVIPHLRELLANLARPGLHDAVKRNTLKVAAESPIPDKFAGLAVDTAFRVLGDPEESIAAKAHSMSILETFCLKEPALSDELRLAIQAQLPYETSPGFRSKARRVLATLDKLKKS